MTLEAAFGKTFRLYDQKELKLPFQILLVTATLIYTRNVFRLIDISVHHDNYIPNHEWLFFTFESAPILLACFIYAYCSFGWTISEGVLDTPTTDTLPHEMALA